MDFFTLASSSAGNSYYLGSSGGGLLIDCGISCKNVVSALKSRDIAPEKLSGIIVTHEHSDHIKGLAVLLSHYHIPLYASAPVLEYLSRNGCVPIGAVLNEIDGSGELIGGAFVSPFKTSHDSVGSLGFSICTSENSKISICTDTGYITDDAKEHIPGSKLVLIESNYDKGMLEAGRYPYSLKRRIEGSFGHLSNNDCAEYLPELIRGGATHIILGHLSKENNFPEVAVETSVSNLSLCGMKRDRDYVLFSAPRSELSEKISF